ncbi:MAG: hypothetical protein WDO24_22635 [Pseudomonadota bacterium]
MSRCATRPASTATASACAPPTSWSAAIAGVYLGAVSHEADASYLLVNTRVLAARDEFGQPATPTNHDAETESARRARRKTTWTPASFDPP